MLDLYLFLAVPVVTALVGWGTNWAAVKMIFHPAQWIGFGPIGWQGIVYRSSSVLAAGVGEMLQGKLLSPREMAGRVDGQALQAFVAEHLPSHAEPLVAAAAESAFPGSWGKLPQPVQEAVLQQIHREALQLVGEVAERLTGAVEEVVDVKAVVMKALSGDNASVLARQTAQIGARELKFIEYYGGIFGLLIGLLEMAAWSVSRHWWVMPIVGVIVGLITNYLAILMIFKPQHPTRYLGLITYQGLFAKRQADIARDYARSTAEEVLTPANLIAMATEGPSGEKVAALIEEAAEARFGELRARLSPLLPGPLDAATIERVRATLMERARALLPEVRGKFEDFLARRLDVANIIEQKLNALSKSEFEGLLRPIFEQDEWILIAVGGVLGGAVGVLQGMLVLMLGA